MFKMKLGLGRSEEAYHQALLIWLRNEQIDCLSKASHWLTLGGERAYCLQPDFVARNSITIELKSVARNLRSTEFVQIYDYLKFRGDRLGLLVNMGLDRVHVERVLYQPKNATLVEDWGTWRNRVDDKQREAGIKIKTALNRIYHEHSTGYGEKVIGQLIPFALRQEGSESDRVSLPCVPITKCHELPASPLNCLVVANQFVVAFTALFDNNQFNCNRAASFLGSLGLRHAVAVNFGKAQAEFRAIYKT